MLLLKMALMMNHRSDGERRAESSHVRPPCLKEVEPLVKRPPDVDPYILKGINGCCPAAARKVEYCADEWDADGCLAVLDFRFGGSECCRREWDAYRGPSGCGMRDVGLQVQVL